MNSQWANPRNLKERIIIEGKLVLKSPALLGSGDSDSLTDMPLLLDEAEKEKKALLPGATLAGALRNFLVLHDPKHDETLARVLFGSVNDEQSQESYFIADDALGEFQGAELRDGVAIDPKTRTALDAKKFDYELLQVGTTFDLRFELLVPKNKDQGDLFIEAVAICLTGLEKGMISLGKRKRRGFGQCKAYSWKVERFDMTRPEGMLRWLEFQDCPDGREERLISKLLLDREITVNEQAGLELDADFKIDGSILIRSGSGSAGSPDSIHLQRIVYDKKIPIVSGTSLTGALRARTIKIGNTLGKDGYKLANSLFGTFALGDEADSAPTVSRVWVDEAEIVNPIQFVQNRIKIDRFTGGVYPGALFNEQPVFARDETGFHLKLRLLDARDWEVGLFLLLLKDLWLGDLPIGGESSIGRGRLCGCDAQLRFNEKQWAISSSQDGSLEVSGTTLANLQKYVDEFVGAEI